jgi:hypothetical protein
MMITRPVSILPAGTSFVRYLKGLKFGPDYTRAQFPGSPHVAAALEARQTKAAIPGALTTDSGGIFTEYGIFDAATAQLLAGHSAFEAARSRMRAIPFETKTPRQTDAGSGGGWVLEGAALPTVSFAFDYLTHRPARCGSLFVCSDELLRNPSAEVVVRDAALGAQGRAETRLLLDPSIGPNGDAPGSITYDIPPVAPSLTAMLAQITTSGRGLAWIGRLQDLALVAMTGGNLAGNFPSSLLGIPIVICPNAPPLQIVLVDLAEVSYSASSLEADLSTQASLEMADNPTVSISAGSPPAPVSTHLVSTYQSNSTAFKLSRFLNWTVARSGAVAWATFGGSPSLV